MSNQHRILSRNHSWGLYAVLLQALYRLSCCKTCCLHTFILLCLANPSSSPPHLSRSFPQFRHSHWTSTHPGISIPRRSGGNLEACLFCHSTVLGSRTIIESALPGLHRVPGHSRSAQHCSACRARHAQGSPHSQSCNRHSRAFHSPCMQ